MEADERAGWSLRRRILAITALASLATLLLGGAAMFVAARAEDEKLMDARLADLGRAILSFSEHEIQEIQSEKQVDLIHVEKDETLGDRYQYQLWSIEPQRLLLRSHAASADRPMLPLSVEGLRTVKLGDEDYRVLSMRNAQGGLVLLVAECLEDRESALGALSLYFLAFLIVPFCAIGTVAWWLVSRSLSAIDGSARQLAERSPIDLAPITASNPPQELRPMVDAINALFARISDAMSLERGFTAMAAHELRSPLAGLRAQAQLANVTTSRTERVQALRAVMQGVDRSAQMLDQLLDLARSESLLGAGGAGYTQVDIDRVIRLAQSDLQHQMQRRGVQLRVGLASRWVFAAEWGLLLLIRNLLSNAIRHAPSGSIIEVRSIERDGVITITVDDGGPGIPASDRQRAFERFERLGHGSDHGVGLGLSIVRAVVQAHAATIRLLDSPLGGLRVEVTFAPLPGVEAHQLTH